MFGEYETPERLRKAFRTDIIPLWKNVYYYIYRNSPVNISVDKLAEKFGKKDHEIRTAVDGLINHKLIKKKTLKKCDGCTYEVI